PEMVLLDIGLPGMDGYEVARRLRAEPSLDGIYLVALTGYGSASDRHKSAEAGFDEHLVKPVEFDALRRVLERTHVGSSSPGFTSRCEQRMAQYGPRAELDLTGSGRAHQELGREFCGGSLNPSGADADLNLCTDGIGSAPPVEPAHQTIDADDHEQEQNGGSE